MTKHTQFTNDGYVKVLFTDSVVGINGKQSKKTNITFPTITSIERQYSAAHIIAKTWDYSYHVSVNKVYNTFMTNKILQGSNIILQQMANKLPGSRYDKLYFSKICNCIIVIHNSPTQ